MTSSTREIAFEDVTGVILVGGKSRRMGTDKAFLEFRGAPLFERVLHVFQAVFSRIFLVGNGGERFAKYDLPVHPDLTSGSALAGLYTGLSEAVTEYIFVSPCDMAFPDQHLVRYLCALAEGHDAVIPVTANGYEPLFGVYGKACLPAMKNMLDDGNFRIYDLYPYVRVRYVEETELASQGINLRSFINLNTPEEHAKHAEDLT